MKNRGFLAKKALTLSNRSDRIIGDNAMTKTSMRYDLFFRELPFGARQQNGSRRIPFRAALLNLPVGGDGCARYCAYGLLGPDEAAVAVN